MPVAAGATYTAQKKPGGLWEDAGRPGACLAFDLNASKTVQDTCLFSSRKRDVCIPCYRNLHRHLGQIRPIESPKIYARRLPRYRMSIKRSIATKPRGSRLPFLANRPHSDDHNEAASLRMRAQRSLQSHRLSFPRSQRSPELQL